MTNLVKKLNAAEIGSVSLCAFCALCPSRITVAHAWHLSRLLKYEHKSPNKVPWTDGLFTVQEPPVQSSRLNRILTIFYLVLRAWRELWFHNRGFSVCWWDTHTISLFDISWQQLTETAGRHIHREQHCCQVNAVVWFAKASGEGCTYIWIKHNFCLFTWKPLSHL